MSSILYQNLSQTITLLDLAKSISDASGVRSVASIGPDRPFPSTEPKGSKRAKLLSCIPQDERRYHKQLSELTAGAMRELHQYLGDRKWCFERTVSNEKRYIPGAAIEECKLQNDSTAYSLKRHIGGTTEECRPQNGLEKGLLTPPLVLSTLANRYDSVTALQDTLVFNPSTSVVRLHASECSFLVPSYSVFLLSSIEQGSRALKMGFKALGGQISALQPGQFDFILLDPPWPNRSVRNSRVYNTYERQFELHPFYQTLPIISQHLSTSGIAAVWITNKRAIRETVLRSLREMDLDLYEEWIWLKTTSSGEPVTAIDGLWRKPYEVLLLFSRMLTVKTGQGECPAYPEVKKRVIIAVPDIHSRKPCLKELLKPLVPENYRALEIFARSLTAGWWSWGDEVLKFNEEGA